MPSRTFAWLLALALPTGEASGPACDEPASFLQHTLHLEESHLAAATEAVQSPGVKTFTLFVKFHKVAGSTWRDYVDALTGEVKYCASDCGFPSWPCYQAARNPAELVLCPQQPPGMCPYRPTSCTFHGSLGVINEAVKDQNITAANISDLAGVQNLWPDSKRFWLYWRVEWARSWLPQNMFHLENKRILVTTILRDPVERIRSYYYYQNPKGNHSLFLDFLHFRRDYVSGNWTMAGFEEQAKTPKGASTFSILHRSCCEYETWLGQGCVEKAKITLATQFDLVGITERMNEAIVSLGKLYGKTAEEMAAIGQHVDRDKDNSGVKLDWTDEEKSLATYIANKSTQVYNFAQEVFVRQYLSLFNSEENLQSAVARFEALLPQD